MRKEDIINRAKLRTEENGNTEDGAQLAKLLQEEAKRKADVLKKDHQLQHQILKLQAMTHLTPLGQDRAFRYSLINCFNAHWLWLLFDWFMVFDG